MAGLLGSVGFIYLKMAVFRSDRVRTSLEPMDIPPIRPSALGPDISGFRPRPRCRSFGVHSHETESAANTDHRHPQTLRWFFAGGTYGFGLVLRFLQIGNLQAYAFIFGAGAVALIYYILFK